MPRSRAAPLRGGRSVLRPTTLSFLSGHSRRVSLSASTSLPLARARGVLGVGPWHERLHGPIPCAGDVSEDALIHPQLPAFSPTAATSPLGDRQGRAIS